MNKFENVDVLSALQKIMQQNTAYFQNDFDIDKKILLRAAQSDNAEDKTYLWMSRPAGTHCLRERDVFIKDTREHNTFRFYAEQTRDKVLAYAVVLSGVENGAVMGSIYEMDYREQAKRVFEKALPVDTVILRFEYGSREQPAQYYFDGSADRELGKFEDFEFYPRDTDALEALLHREQHSRQQLAPGDLCTHTAKLADARVCDEAHRIAEVFGNLKEPNSPNKTHFMVEVSPAFMLLASSKEQGRLQAMLPYKSLSLSSMKDKRGVYALIGKEENRSLPLRRLRPSVREQLKAGKQQKAAPKRAAKSKESDLEV